MLEDNKMCLFNEFENEKIDTMNMRGRRTRDLKKMDLIAYLFEIAYDICISPIDNMSQNPGFEACLGVF